MNKLLSVIKKHAPLILSIGASCGVVATAVLSAKASVKAQEAIGTAEYIKKEIFTPQEKLKIAVPIYLPTVLMGTATISCILGAHALDIRQQSAVIGAYSLLNESYQQYRNASKEVYGEDAESKIEAQMAKDTYVYAGDSAVYVSEEDTSEKVLWYDMYSQRYFQATFSAILNAQYHVNRNLQLRGFVPLNEFYEFIGIDGIEDGDTVGWVTDVIFETGLGWLDFDNRLTTLDDGMECYILSYGLLPEVMQEE